MNRRDRHHSPAAPTWSAALILLSWLLGAMPAHSRTVEITLIHTTDLHGHIWPTEDYDGNPNLGGLLRCASKIEELRVARPNPLLIDCGDSYQGSPESYLTEGRLIVEAFNLLDYDAWALGNHEFDWGVAALRDRHDEVQIPFLAANLYFRDEGLDWLPKVKPYVIRETEGVRVAIVGLVTPGVPRWSRPHLLNGAMFRDSVEALEAIWPDVKAEDPDIIVVAAHQGHKPSGDDFANEVTAITRAFPEIDVFIGGHTHKPIAEMKYGDVLYSQAGYHGIWLGEVDLVYDTVAGRVTGKSGRLHHMDASVPYHEDLLARWREILKEKESVLAGVVGYLDGPLSSSPDRKGRSSMQHFICRAIAEGVDSDFVMHGSLARDEVPAGPVTYRDVWKIVPYENTIGTLYLTTAQMREILEEAFARELYHYALGPFGFDFDLGYEDGQPVVGNFRDDTGKPLHARKKYRVAFNSYVLASGGERHLVVRRFADQPEGMLEMFDVDTRNLVVELLKREQQARREEGDR